MTGTVIRPEDSTRQPRAGVSNRPGIFDRDRNELLWAILENLSEGVVACDAEGQLSFFNRATRQFHGIGEESMAASHWSEHYSLFRADGTPMPADEVPLVRALRGEILHDVAMVIAPHHREATTVICSGQPLHDSSGRLLGAVVVMRDITQQIVAERQKAALVSERELSLAKDEFLANVAHELRNPLTSILAWTQMLQLREEEARTALEAIAASTRLQAQLIEDLSDAARIAAGKMTLHRKLTPVRALLEDAINGARPSAEVKRIMLVTPRYDENIAVEADKARLQQVFWNLLTNAIKFTPTLGTITVGVTVEEPNIRVTVSDTGCGISSQFLPRVFDRYAQENDTDSNRSHGLGLGLSIARTIVDLHGGSITVSSAGEGSGSSFCVTLPLARPRQLSSEDS